MINLNSNIDFPLAEEMVVGAINDNFIIADCKVISYLQRTKEKIASIKTPNGKFYAEMIDYVLKYWNTNQRNEALSIVAAKEKELRLKLPSELKRDEGFFQIFNEIYRDELSGVFKNLKEKQVGKKIVAKINKVNPLTIAARNAFRALVALNLFGLATILSADNAKAKSVFEKTKKLYVQLGGDASKILASIERGKKRKPLFNKELKAEFNKNKNNKIEGLGVIAESGLIASAGTLLAKVWSFVKDSGLSLEKKADSKEIDASTDKGQPSENSKKDRKDRKLFSKFISSGIAKAEKIIDGNPKAKEKTSDNAKSDEAALKAYEEKNKQDSLTSEQDKKKKRNRNIAIAAIAATAIGGTAAYYYYNKNNKAKINAPRANKPVKLQGIKLS